MDEEIDLRPYIEQLLHSWQWIVGSGFVVALIALLISFWLPDRYEATASVAIVRSRTDVNFDPRMEDVVDGELIRTDMTARRQALVALVMNNDVALSVLAELGDTLPVKMHSVEALLNMVSASNEGDLIAIRVRSAEPEIAAAIANAWSRYYQDMVNNLYGATGNINMDSLAIQVQSAAVTYALAQEQVETFISTSHIAVLEGEIAAEQELVDAYRAALVAVQAEPVILQSDTNQAVLAGYYKILQDTELWLSDAKVLQDLLQAGRGSAGADLGNVLAFIALQNRVFVGSATIDLQVDVPGGLVEPILMRDIEAVIGVLESRHSAVMAQIEALTAVWIEAAPQEIILPDNHPLNISIAQLEEDIQKLQAELEAEQAEQRELEEGRNRAWETYLTLTRKLTEEEIALEAIGTEVRLVAQAVAPLEPIRTSKPSIILVAAVTGTFMAVLFILMQTWWQQYLSQAQGMMGKKSVNEADVPR